MNIQKNAKVCTFVNTFAMLNHAPNTDTYMNLLHLLNCDVPRVMCDV